MRLHVDGQGPLVVKIAGLVGGTGLYHEEVRRAAAAGFRVATIDTAGDRRDDPATAPLSWDSLSSEVACGIDRLGEEPAVLWGHSFGCLVALAVAARTPEKVRGMLLSFPPNPEWRPAPYMTLFRWTTRRRNPGFWAWLMFHAAFFTLTGWEFVIPSALRRLPDLSRAANEALTPGSTIHDKLRLMWTDHPGTADPSIPASIVAATLDTVTTRGNVRIFAATRPTVTVRWLRGVGHAGAFSRPETYNRLAIEELARLTGQSLAARSANVS